MQYLACGTSTPDPGHQGFSGCLPWSRSVPLSHSICLPRPLKLSGSKSRHKKARTVMDKYPRTHLGLWLTISFLFVFASLPALAQNGSIRSNNQQAALHIRVNVVRPVSLPPVTPGQPHDDVVTYNVS